MQGIGRRLEQAVKRGRGIPFATTGSGVIVFGILGLGLILGAIWHEIQVWRGKRLRD